MFFSSDPAVSSSIFAGAETCEREDNLIRNHEHVNRYISISALFLICQHVRYTIGHATEDEESQLPMKIFGLAEG